MNQVIAQYMQKLRAGDPVVEITIDGCSTADVPQLLEMLDSIPSDLPLENVIIKDVDFNGFSANFSKLAHVKELQLVNCEFDESFDLRSFPDLKALAMERCKLKRELIMGMCPKLETLVLSDCGLSSVPTLNYNRKLKKITISHFTDDGGLDLSIFPDLHELCIYACKLSRVPILTRSPELRTLVLSDCGISQVPDLKKNLKLQELILYNNSIKQPPDLSRNIELRHLDLSKNDIRGPVYMVGLMNLEVLKLANNKMVFPYLTQNTPLKLRLLDISGNPIKEISFKHLQLPSLVELDASHCSLVAADLNVLPVLATCKLNANEIVELDLTGAPRLERLDVSENCMQSLPSSSEVNVLVSLDASDNPLELLDHSVQPTNRSGVVTLGHFPELRCLTLNRCGITEITGFELVPKLRDLSLEENRLNSVPPSLGILRELASLSLNSNEIVMAMLPGMMLSSVDLSDNQLEAVVLPRGNRSEAVYNLDANPLTEASKTLLEAYNARSEYKRVTFDDESAEEFSVVYSSEEDDVDTVSEPEWEISKRDLEEHFRIICKYASEEAIKYCSSFIERDRWFDRDASNDNIFLSQIRKSYLESLFKQNPPFVLLMLQGFCRDLCNYNVTLGEQRQQISQDSSWYREKLQFLLLCFETEAHKLMGTQQHALLWHSVDRTAGDQTTAPRSPGKRLRLDKAF